MDRVLDRLWIGAKGDIDVAASLPALGFTALVDLRDGVGAYTVPGLAVYCLANRDGDPWSAAQVEGALAFVGEAVRRGRVLVACAAGMSRSASVVVGYLARCGWSAAEALAHVRRARPEAAPVPSMLASALAGVGGSAP